MLGNIEMSCLGIYLCWSLVPVIVSEVVGRFRVYPASQLCPYLYASVQRTAALDLAVRIECAAGTEQTLVRHAAALPFTWLVSLIFEPHRTRAKNLENTRTVLQPCQTNAFLHRNHPRMLVFLEKLGWYDLTCTSGNKLISLRRNLLDFRTPLAPGFDSYSRTGCSRW